MSKPNPKPKTRSKRELTRLGRLPACYPEYAGPEQEAVDVILCGIPPEGGHATPAVWEDVIRAAFRGGVVAVRTEQPELAGKPLHDIGERTFGVPEVLRELRRLKYDLEVSYREVDGRITNVDVLWSVDCLDAAIVCVKESRDCGPWRSVRRRATR